MSSVGFFSSTFASSLGVSTSLSIRKSDPETSLPSSAASSSAVIAAGGTPGAIETSASKPVNSSEDRSTPDPKSESPSIPRLPDEEDQSERIEEFIESFRDRMKRLGVFMDPEDLETPPAPPEIQRRIIEATAPELALERKKEAIAPRDGDSEPAKEVRRLSSDTPFASASSVDTTI